MLLDRPKKDYSKFLLWLVPGVVLVAFISLGIFIHGNIMNGSDQEKRLYTTALQTKNDDEFNYSVDTKQGNVLAYGTFTTLSGVKFDEMDKTFMAVVRYKERYTRHTREECTTDSNGNESCYTKVYYEWNIIGSDKKEAPKVKFAGREYDTALFYFSLEGIEASEFVKEADRYYYPGGKPGFWGANEGDIRYWYQIVPEEVRGSILVNTSDGGLKSPTGGKIGVSDLPVKERVERVKKNATTKSVVFIVAWSILTLGASAGAGYFALQKMWY